MGGFKRKEIGEFSFSGTNLGFGRWYIYRYVRKDSGGDFWLLWVGKNKNLCTQVSEGFERRIIAGRNEFSQSFRVCFLLFFLFPFTFNTPWSSYRDPSPDDKWRTPLPGSTLAVPPKRTRGAHLYPGPPEWSTRHSQALCPDGNISYLGILSGSLTVASNPCWVIPDNLP